MQEPTPTSNRSTVPIPHKSGFVPSDVRALPENPQHWRWFHYLWNLSKEIGFETYKTWRWELFSSAIVILFLGLITSNWKDFKSASLATALTLGCFIFWHIVRAPWLLHRKIHGSDSEVRSSATGLLGLFAMVALVSGSVILGETLWELKPLGVIETAAKNVPVPMPISGQTRIIEGPCKLTSEQINPARSPQPCTSSPPTLRDRVLAVNSHLTEGDRNRFSNALSELENSLNQGRAIFSKLSVEGGSLARESREGTITKTVQLHKKTLNDLAGEGWKYQKEFPQLRLKWEMFREQVEYIFGDNPDNEGPNSLINAAEGYRNYLERWGSIENKEQRPILDLLYSEQNEFQAFLNTYGKWQQGCTARLTEMRNSIR